MKTGAYRHRLPQGDGGLFLSDGGIETCLIFQDGRDLPCFAAFPLMRDGKGRQSLVRYDELRPRGDGYLPGETMSEDTAEAYHALQVAAFADAGADMVTAITMTNTSEAIGIVWPALQAGMPVAIAFTVETDGRLPTGQTLAEAIRIVDQATATGPAYYMINCAHPAHFREVMEADQDGTRRIRGLRANASRRSHMEPNDSPDLDAGDPIELGGQYRAFVQAHPQINVLGGCCGTDHRHVESIALACRTVSAAGTA